MKKLTISIFVILLFLTGWFARKSEIAAAQNPPSNAILIPSGGGITEILPAISQAAINNAKSSLIRILILPVTLTPNADDLSEAERREALRTAEVLQDEIAATCQQIAGISLTCHVEVAPILTRTEALDTASLEYFNIWLSAIYIPDGNAGTALDVIGGTLIEGALVRAHQQGTIIAGAGTGASLLSTAMIHGYHPGYRAENGLRFNAVDLWANAEQHGFLFGIQNAIIDSHFFADNHIGRLLNAISMPGAPHIGIGIDTGTGVQSPDGKRLEGVFGRSAIMILDGVTFHAASSIRYRGCGEFEPAVLPCTPLISLRNVLVHLLAPGDYHYDLTTLQTSLALLPDATERSFDTIRLPPGAGSLFLSGGLEFSTEGSPILSRFSEVSGGKEAHILVIAAGYLTDIQARSTAQAIANATNALADILVVPANGHIEPGITLPYNGIIVTSPDPSQITPELFAPLFSIWRDGTPLLLDDSAAALAGRLFVSQPIPAEGSPLSDLTASRTFLNGYVASEAGLNLLPITVEPRLISGNRWGRLFSAANADKEVIALGLNKNAAVEINQDGVFVLGENPVVVLDLRQARLDRGDNQAFVIANGLLDVFAPGEALHAEPVESLSSAEQASTPVLVTATSTAVPTATFTLTPTSTPKPTRTHRPTQTPRPTATPPVIPPPSNPNTSQWMIAFAILIVVVILFGLMINRRRLS